MKTIFVGDFTCIYSSNIPANLGKLKVSSNWILFLSVFTNIYMHHNNNEVFNGWQMKLDGRHT